MAYLCALFRSCVVQFSQTYVYTIFRKKYYTGPSLYRGNWAPPPVPRYNEDRITLK